MFGITPPSQNPFSFNTLVFLPSLPTCSCPLSPISILTSQLQTPAIDLSKLKMEQARASRGLQGPGPPNPPEASRASKSWLQAPAGGFRGLLQEPNASSLQGLQGPLGAFRTPSSQTPSASEPPGTSRISAGGSKACNTGLQGRASGLQPALQKNLNPKS